MKSFSLKQNFSLINIYWTVIRPGTAICAGDTTVDKTKICSDKTHRHMIKTLNERHLRWMSVISLSSHPLFWVFKSCHFFYLFVCVGNLNSFLVRSLEMFLGKLSFLNCDLPYVIKKTKNKTTQQSPQHTWPAPCRGFQPWLSARSQWLFFVAKLRSINTQLPFLQAVIVTYLRMSLLLLYPFSSDTSMLPFLLIHFYHS